MNKNLSKILVFTLSFILCQTLFAYSEEDKSNKEKLETNYITVQEDPNNSLGIIYASNKLNQVTQQLTNGNLDEAIKELEELSTWLTNATDNHYELYSSFSKNAELKSASKLEKAYAHDFAELRDKSYYLLAQSYIRQNKLRKAVELLVKIVSSQPDSELGNEAYKSLQKIRFSD